MRAEAADLRRETSTRSRPRARFPAAPWPSRDGRAPGSTSAARRSGSRGLVGGRARRRGGARPSTLRCRASSRRSSCRRRTRPSRRDAAPRPSRGDEDGARDPRARATARSRSSSGRPGRDGRPRRPARGDRRDGARRSPSSRSARATASRTSDVGPDRREGRVRRRARRTRACPSSRRRPSSRRSRFRSSPTATRSSRGSRRRPGVRYPVLVPNEKGLDGPLAAGAREIAVFTAASDTFNRRNINASIDESFDRFAPVLRRAREPEDPRARLRVDASSAARTRGRFRRAAPWRRAAAARRSGARRSRSATRSASACRHRSPRSSAAP